MLIAHPQGHYRFLQGIDPYSCGVVAEPGWEIVRVVLAEPLPWREGFERVDAHLAAEGCDRVSLCAMELRSPAPFTMQGFIDFNREYCVVLKAWGLYVDELNPVARTNVAPAFDPPGCAFVVCFFIRGSQRPDRPQNADRGWGWRVAGGSLVTEGIIRPGDTSPAAMREKAAYVAQVMGGRLAGLGGDVGSDRRG